MDVRSHPIIPVAIIISLAAMALLVFASPGTVAALADTDDHWAESTIEQMYEMDIVYPLSEDRFAPDQPISRLDFSRWVVRSLGEEPLDEELDFVDTGDIPREARAEVARAVDYGLIKGYPDGSFAPDDTITRIQMGTILGRVLEEVGVRARPGYLALFEDSDDIPDWGVPAAAAVEKRLIIGRQAFKIFAPNDPTTRAEAAEMLARFMQVLQEVDRKDKFAPPDLADPDPDPDFLLAGYYMGRDVNRGESYRTVQDFGEHMNMIIMSTEYGFQIREDSVHLSGYDSEFLFSEAAAREDQDILVRITNSFDPDVAAKILNNPRYRDQALAAIEDVLARGYDGVNINFEDVRPADRDAMTAFMAALWRRIGSDHLVTMAVPAAVENNPEHGWSGAFDYESLGENVHYLIPMAYDNHWRTGSPGPVAPLDWVKDVVEYTVSTVSPEKVLLGAPFYGYDWLDTGEPNPARAVRWDEAVERAQEFAADIQWCDTAESPYYRYRCEDGDERIVHFENEQSLEAKLQLVSEYDLAGVAFWRFGQEGAGAWPVIDDTLR